MKGNFLSTCLKVLIGAGVGAGVVGIATSTIIRNKKKFETPDNTSTENKQSK